MDEKMSIWQAARSMWMKYCGICDEYKMLRDRWLYLYDEDSLPVLPLLKAPSGSDTKYTFDILDEHIEKLEGIFEKCFGFRRKELEDYTNSLEKFENIDLNEYSAIKSRLFDLSQYIGILKFAFFQRTISSETSHVISGAPHSPERTMGNELFYLAADKVTERYFKCLNIPYYSWDGFVSFIPPVGSGGFYGAFGLPLKSFRIFHISMSEEQKYFVGSYMAIAHELGHILMDGYDATYPEKHIIDKLRFLCIAHVTKTWKKRFDGCEKCIYNPNKMISFIPRNRDPFKEYFADIIALNIGGVHTANVLLNEVYYSVDDVYPIINDKKIMIKCLFPPYPELFLRFGGVTSYLKRTGVKEGEDLKFRFDDLVKRSERVVKGEHKKWIRELGNEGYEVELHGLSERNECIKCLESLGEGWTDFVMSQGILEPLIREDFEIDDHEKDRIVNSLLTGTPCPDADPRHILHCYYEAYKESEGERRPSYAATIHSLAFNKYSSEE